MTFSVASYIFLISLFASITFNGFFRNIANNNKILIDLPDKSRKFHHRATPLTGGISIFAACLLSTFLLEGLSDLTGIHVETNINSDRFASASTRDNFSKKYKINQIDYEVLIPYDQISKDISLKVIADNSRISSINISKNEDGNFVLILPDKSSETYKYENGTVTKITSNQEQSVTPQPIEEFGIKIDFYSVTLLICGALIIIVMLVDDLIGIRAIYRLGFQVFVVSIVIYLTGYSLTNLGNLLGLGDINLGIFSYAFTIFCVVGLMNAFNMSDGLNGICASFGLIPLIFLLFFDSGKYGLIVPIGALTGFLAYNLGYFGKKRRVFLGDTGSNCLGFLLAWVCISLSQIDQTLNPVTALWLVALPLLDCIVVMTSRLLKGIQPFRPGRDHLHHKLLDSGYSPNKILGIFLMSSVILSCVGFWFEAVYPDQEFISFYFFLLFIIAYYTTIKTQLKKDA